MSSDGSPGEDTRHKPLCDVNLYPDDRDDPHLCNLGCDDDGSSVSREARRLGLLDGDLIKPAKTRQTRKTAPGPYRSTCRACSEVFTTRAGEDRHVENTRHCRFQVFP